MIALKRRGTAANQARPWPARISRDERHRSRLATRDAPHGELHLGRPRWNAQSEITVARNNFVTHERVRGGADLNRPQRSPAGAEGHLQHARRDRRNPDTHGRARIARVGVHATWVGVVVGVLVAVGVGVNVLVGTAVGRGGAV